MLNEDHLVIYLNYNNRSIVFNDEDQTVTVGAMVQLGEFNAFLDQYNLSWEVNFSAHSASIAGIVSTNAGGERSKAASQVAYFDLIGGDGKEYRLYSDLEQTHSMFPKLGTATQGLLGLITSITIHVKPRFKETLSAMVTIPYDQVNLFVDKLRESPYLIACEMMDHKCIKEVLDRQDDGMTLLIKWGSVNTLNLESEFEGLVNSFPDYVESMMVSDSVSSEEALWKSRHDLSDTLRHVAKQKNMAYIGYDLGIPKDSLSRVINELNHYISSQGGYLFVFGHSMQSKTHYTLHCNYMMKKINPQLLPRFIKDELSDFDIHFSTEHGGCGEKSFNDILFVISQQELKDILVLTRQYDPNDLFRRNFKQLLEENIKS